MPGKLLQGIECLDHGLIYHEECFNRGVPEEDYYEDPYEDMRILPVVDLSDVDSGDLHRDRDDAEKLLTGTQHGTFLLRLSRRRNKFVISSKQNDDIVHYMIDQADLNGETYYWMVQGSSEKSVLDVIHRHRESHEIGRAHV